MLFFGSALRNPDFSRQTPGFLLNLVVFLSSSAFVTLFHRAASSTVFLHFLLTDTWPESCLGATSLLNEIFKIVSEFRWSQDAVTPPPRLLACRPLQALQVLVQEQGCFQCHEYIFEQERILVCQLL